MFTASKQGAKPTFGAGPVAKLNFGGPAEPSTDRGVQIADPATANILLSIQTKPELQLQVVQFDPRTPVETILLATRAPQTTACRLDVISARQLPWQLGVSHTGNGVFAPVYTDTQAMYAQLRQRFNLLDERFTTRGCPPDIADDTLLWPLPSLEPCDAEPMFVHACEDGLFDVVSWAAWTAVSAAVAGCDKATDLRDVLQAVRDACESNPTQAATLAGRVRAVFLAVQQVTYYMDAVQRARRLALAAAQPNPPIVLPLLYNGVYHLAKCAQFADAAKVIRAAVWTARAHAYLTDPDLGLTQPTPETLSEELDLSRLAWAGMISSLATRFCHVSGPHALAIAERICGGGKFIATSDCWALVHFACSPYIFAPDAAERLAWVAQWS